VIVLAIPPPKKKKLVMNDKVPVFFSLKFIIIWGTLDIKAKLLKIPKNMLIKTVKVYTFSGKTLDNKSPSTEQYKTKRLK